MRAGIGAVEHVPVDEVVAAARAAGERVYVLAQNITDYEHFRREHGLDHHLGCYLNSAATLRGVQVRCWVSLPDAHLRHDAVELFQWFRRNLARLGADGA